MGEAFDRVIERLESRCGPGKKAGHWIRFPHPLSDGKDEKRSFGVMERPDGKVSCVSHKGHSVQDTLRALGLEWKDLYPPDPRKFSTFQGSRVVRQYEYLTHTGVKVGAVQRTENKDFPQGRYENNDFKYGLDTVKLPIYMATEVRQAIQDGLTIYVVEGEKDVEALWAIGTPATTKPGGAKGEWTAGQLADLSGARIVVVADKDAPGYECAQKTAKALLSVGCDVKGIVEAKTGKDASDHLEAGHGIEEFIPRPDLNPGPGLKGLVTLNGTFKLVEASFLIEPFFPAGKAILVDGDSGLGKSSWLLSIAAGGSNGYVPFGKVAEPFKTLYMYADADTVDEYETVYRGNGGREGWITYCPGAMSLTPQVVDDIIATVKAGGYKFVVFDPLLYYLQGIVQDTSQNMQVLNALQEMNRIPAETGATVAGLRHTGKWVQGKPAGDLGIGSYQFKASFRGLLLMRWHPEKRGVVVVTDEKGSILVPRGDAFMFRRVDLELQYLEGEDNPFDGAAYEEKGKGHGRPTSEKRTKCNDFIDEKIRQCMFVPYRAAEEFRKENDIDRFTWNNAIKGKSLTYANDFCGQAGYIGEMSYDPMKDN